MKFRKGETYSRREISDELGGQLQHYLPFKGDKILCGCFRPERRYSPEAPEKVHFGEGDVVRQSAELMSQQSEPIPVFLCERARKWKYIGLYRCYGYTTEPSLLKQEERKYPERGIIKGVLYFKEIP
jgi:hypothetical protein